MARRVVPMVLCVLAAGALHGTDIPLHIAGYPEPEVFGAVKHIKEFSGRNLSSLLLKSTSTFSPGGQVEKLECYAPDGKLHSIKHYSYNSDGSLQEVRGEHPSGTILWRQLYKYNEAGQLQEESSWTQEGVLEWRHLYHYSRRGLLSEKVVYGEADTETMRELYRYNDRGLLSHWRILFPDGKLLKQVNFIYNDLGLISEEQYHNESTLYKTKKYFYNKNSLWERVLTSNSKGEPGETTLYFYNGDGRVVEEITRKADGTIKRQIVTTYDHMGNEFSRIDSSGSYLLRETTY